MSLVPRDPGMDHELYAYSPLPTRRRVTWPDGARLAVWTTLYLEFWELEPPSASRRAPGVHGHWGHFFPDFRTFSYREYGNRVGIFRVLEVLDRYAIPVTVAANTMAIDRYPELVEECLRRNWEIVPHGRSATQMITSAMSEDQEREVIEEGIESVRRASGSAPTGWIGQDFNESTRTPALVADAGLRWIADWPNDDQPYWMTVSPPIVSIPRQPDWDDVQLLWLRQHATWKYPSLIRSAAGQLAVEGEDSARSFELSIHPWLLGQPHRIAYLDRALAGLREMPEVWWSTAGDIATAFSRSVPNPASADANENSS
jgi:allantoinase